MFLARRPSPASRSIGSEVPIRLVLIAPPAGVAFGIQRGRGARYETLFVQERKRGDVTFDFTVTCAGTRADGRPSLQGPFVQGPLTGRFVLGDWEIVKGTR